MLKMKVSLSYDAEIKPITETLKLQRDFNSCLTIQNIYNIINISLSNVEGYHMMVTDGVKGFLVKSCDIIGVSPQY